MTRLFLVLAALLLATPAWAHGLSEADKVAMLSAGYRHYVWLGAKHMLTGYDHLLFIFGVVFFLTRFIDVLKFITAFTLGHSITLVLATLFGISANYFLIDAVIALSVCYKGFENLDGFRRFLDTASPNLLAVISAFGLVHGFGLSTRLQQLPLGDDTTSLVLRILSFNLGVEVGQVMALSVMVVLLAGWRRSAYFRRFSAVSNVALLAAGALLFLMQMHSYMHQHDPDEFGFSEDNHAHAHEAMITLSGELVGANFSGK